VDLHKFVNRGSVALNKAYLIVESGQAFRRRVLAEVTAPA
jgi:hypothetical protein